MNAPVSVLVARFLAFGDVLLTLPLVEALDRSPGVASVDVLTQRRYAELLVRSQHVRRVWTTDPDRDYDVLLDLHTRAAPLDPGIEAMLGRVRAARRVGFADPWHPGTDGRLPTRRADEHAVEYYARAAGPLIDGPPGPGVVPIAAPDLAAAARLVPQGAVAIAPGARYRFKRWPRSHYAKLVALLAERDVPAVLVGHPFDREFIEPVRAATGAPAVVLDDDYHLAAALRACGVVIANNSGMAHLAQVAGAAVVCVHSHTRPAMWRPWGDGHVNLVGAPGPCACAGLTEFETPVPCGRAIEPERVADAVLGLPR